MREFDKMGKSDTRTEMQKLARVSPESYRGCISGVADGWFTAEDAETYRELVLPIKNGEIIEIGSYEGLSLYHIKDICKENNTILISVDFMKWEKLVKNTQEWGIEFINLPSIDAAELFSDGHFDLVFLDATHRSSAVAKDIKAWMPKIKKDGILAGHDFCLKRVRNAIKYCLDITKVNSKADIWWYKKP